MENTFLERSHGSDVPCYHGDICIIQLMDSLHGNVCSLRAIVFKLVIQRVGEFTPEVLQLPYILSGAYCADFTGLMLS